MIGDDAPYVAHSETSKAAAEAIEPSTSTLRAAVFQHIKSQGANGATDDEVQVSLGMNPSTQRPRRIELCDAGAVVDSGLCRPTRSNRQAVVWVNVDDYSAVKRPSNKLLDRFGNPLSDAYCTPAWLTAMLPPVDVDPCSNPRSTVRARRSYSLEKRLDGLKLPWNGSVFLNWPYSDPMPWAMKLIEELTNGHCTEAIVLCKLDPTVSWWHTLTSFGPPEMWTFDRRLQFDEPAELIAERVRKFTEAGKPGGEKSSTNFASTIVHHRGAAGVLQLEQVATRWLRAA
jgi:hypothetical protein